VDGAVLEFALDGRTLMGRHGVAGIGSQPPRAVEVILARGLHDLRLEAVLAAADSTIGLEWTPPEGEPASIPLALLYQGPSGGLAGEIWTGVEGASLASFAGLSEVAPTVRQTDPFLAFQALTDLTGSQPQAARWRGWLDVPVEGKVVFEIHSNGPARLVIDGAGLPECPAGGSVKDEVQLAAGAHDVELDYAWSEGRSRLEWWWAPPGVEKLALVPPTVLRPRDRMWLPGEIPDPPRLGGRATSANVEAPLRAVQTLSGRWGLSNPRGVGVDSRGRVFVADTGEHRVVRIENGKVSASWGRNASEPGPGRFGVLSDLAVAADGRVATLDQQTGDVTLFDGDGKVERYLPHLGTNASGIELDDAGAIWVADTGGSRLLVIGPDGAVSATWTGEGGGFERLEQPIDVVVDDRGVIYAVDLRRRIVRFADDGRIDAQWEVEIGLQRGGSHLAFRQGRVLMTQPDRGLLVVLDPATGGLRYLAIETRIPLGIDAGADGRTYVVDTDAGRVHVYDGLK
jgi:sugar lactone lactonase YvrE